MTREQLLGKPYIATGDLMAYYNICDKKAADVLRRIKTVSDTLNTVGKITPCDFVAYERSKGMEYPNPTVELEKKYIAGISKIQKIIGELGEIVSNSVNPS